ncbi:MAG: DUF1801 domain-containing protein [Vicinamibacterales bacterium]
MATGPPATVKEYLAGLDSERRAVISAVRKLIRRHLPKGYRESMSWGMISYVIPLSRYPDTYNGRPLCYAALASQKNYCALYLMSVYSDPEQTAWLKKEFGKAGKKLDMGRSCLRFRKLDDLPLEAIAQVIAATPPETFIERVETARAGARR